jgi:hypothetical protein
MKPCLPSNNPQGTSAMVEAMDKFNMVPTSMSCMYEVFDTIHIPWIYTWMCLYQVAFALVGKDVEIFTRILGTCLATIHSLGW